jgi:hypothetical protein
MIDMAPSRVDGYFDEARHDKARQGKARQGAANFCHAILDNILLVQTTVSLGMLRIIDAKGSWRRGAISGPGESLELSRLGCY